MEFNTKADTLSQLEPCLKSGLVLPQYCFSYADWRSDKQNVITQFFDHYAWSQNKVVVRSSAVAEDCNNQSLAGHFDSILDVDGQVEIIAAIEKVIASFKEANDNDQIFIQPMLKKVKRSGVVFTREPSTGSPYYVINYSESGSTESVTSGASNEEVLYVAKCIEYRNTHAWLNSLLALCHELEQLFERDTLDIEFAFDEQDKLVLFQVRPLIVKNQTDLAEHQQQLENIHHFLQRFTRPHPYLNGKKSVLGVMPDWNPAEIIGIRPKPLAISLYKELVTNSIWAYQRNNYGYKQLRSFPLLVSLSGLPYIDVRVSFNSFIPADIPEELAEKLVNYYIDQLEQSPEKHDKIEFDIIFSCFTLDIEQRLSKLLEHGFNQQEVEQLTNSLRNLTNNIIHPDGLWAKDIAKIEKLPLRREKILASHLAPIEKLYWLLEDCKRYGTLPFAGLARAGFIAVQFLKSLVSDGILTQADYDAFMRSLETVSSNMSKDRQQLSFNAFLQKYGHLRPGTYDILSPRYDQAPEKYFSDNINEHDKEHEQESVFSLSLPQLEQLKDKLNQHGINHDVISLFRFIKGAIEGREYAKFVFTHSLSDAIELIEDLGQQCNLTKEQMSYCDVSALYNASASTSPLCNILRNSIMEGEAANQLTQQLILPPLICKPDDIYCFSMPEGEPNFITLKSVTAHICRELENIQELSGKIVFIPSADPGFDWLFSHNIAGLITQFGGANSHMAIRAGELGIPSVIGAGEVLYNNWAKADLLQLDAGNRRVGILK